MESFATSLDPPDVRRTPATATPNNAKPTSTKRFRHRNEAARERDVIRYLSAWDYTHKPTTLLRDSFPNGTAIPTPVACPDKALTALAQLCALRLNVQTCLVTLVNGLKEFVLADVSQSTSFQDSADIAGSAWVGTSSFDRENGVTVEALAEWQKARRARVPASELDFYHTQGMTQHSFIISDVRADHRSRKAELFRRGPWIRFFCSVPIRSGQGSVLGSLTLLDNRPRYGISAAELLLLEDMSDTILEHLHSTIVRTQQERSQRLLQALSCFNEGEESLRDWWLARDDARVDNKGRNTDRGTTRDRSDRADVEFGQQKPLNGSESGIDDVPSQLTRFDRDSSNVGHSEETHHEQSLLLGHKNDAGEQRVGYFERQTAVSKISKSNEDGVDLGISVPGAYSRASNLVREALGIEGVAFLSLDFAPDQPKEEDSHNSSLSVDEDGGNGSSSETKSRTCKVHGHSRRGSLDTDDSRTQTGVFGVPVAHLRRLVNRFPQGHVFYFGEDYRVEPSSEDKGPSGSSDVAARKLRRRLKDVEAIGKAVEGIHSAAIYPLWDDATERWRSCLFAYSTNDARTLDQHEDLAYLRTFSHSLTIELSRLQSMAADQAKSTFISSISHELRSPLHGILAGVEFLQETELNTFQSEMTNTINTAGQVLLDTIDHVLDHAKISTATRVSKKIGRRDASSQPDREQSIQATDLAQLTESVVETSVSAYRSQTQSTLSSRNDLWQNRSPNRSSIYAMDASSKVAVTLNISPRKQWHANVPPGAWTRVLTNLVGNALKYTHEGHISVRLDASPHPYGSEATETSIVNLVIADTGLGMSESFLANDALIPFKQEDPYASGTGLGLSIVKQMVTSLRGKLYITSKRGEGTRITVQIPTNLQAHNTSDKNNPSFLDNSLSGQHAVSTSYVHLLTMPGNGSTMVGKDGDGVLNPVGQSVIESTRQWLGCHVSTTLDELNSTGYPRTSVTFIITEDVLEAWCADSSQSFASSIRDMVPGPAKILVLADDLRSVSLSQALKDLPVEVVFMHQPIGPRKLLRAMTLEPADVLVEHPSESDSANEAASSGSLGKSLVSMEHTRDTLSADHSRLSKSPMTKGPRDTVLVVEDNEINMRLLTTLLRKLQIPYETAVNGREAVELFRQTPLAFFLVLMDINMPIMDGITATARIREHEAKLNLSPPRLYILALTGVTDQVSTEKAFESGVDDFYSKPVKMKELRGVLEKVRSAGDAVAEDGTKRGAGK